MNRKFIENSNYILRKILNSNNTLDILKNFIETFLKIQIINIKLNKSPENCGIADVRIETIENVSLNVGIQIIDGDYIQNKMFLYYARVHTNQLAYGDNRKIAKTITINILDLAYFSSKKYHKKISIKSNVVNDSILETIDMHVLELPKFKHGDKELTIEEAWMAYLQGEDEKTIKEAKEKYKKINKLDDLLEKYWKDEVIQK